MTGPKFLSVTGTQNTMQLAQANCNANQEDQVAEHPTDESYFCLSISQCLAEVHVAALQISSNRALVENAGRMGYNIKQPCPEPT